MSLQDFADVAVVKSLMYGDPGMGKTGSVAALVNSGRYNLRVLALDGNTTTSVLRQYVKQEFYDRMSVYVPPMDLTRLGSDGSETVGIPKRFSIVYNMLDQWKFTRPNGVEVDLGPVKSWGPKDILMIDNLTQMSTDAMQHTMFQASRVGKNRRPKDYGTAQDFIRALMEKLASSLIPCNVLVLAHVKMIGPPEPEEKDEEDVREHKKAVRDIIPYKLYPRVVGRDLAREIARFFPYSLFYDRRIMGTQVKRFITTQPRDTADAKAPLDLPTELPIETGLLTIFNMVHGSGEEKKA